MHVTGMTLSPCHAAHTSKMQPLTRHSLWLSARHKSIFFAEQDTEGQVIDYLHAVKGGLKIAPTGQAREALAKDYALMIEDDAMVGNALAFDELMQACISLEYIINKA